MLRGSSIPFSEDEDAFPAVAIMALADSGRSTRSDRSWLAPQRAKDSQKCPDTEKEKGPIPEIPYRLNACRTGRPLPHATAVIDLRQGCQAP